MSIPSEPYATRALRTGVACGLALGGALAGLLLWSARGGRGERAEGAVIGASLLAAPSSYLFDALDWGHWASQWLAFIAIALPLNGALLGVLSGGLLAWMRRRSPGPWRPRIDALAVSTLLLLLWSGAVAAAWPRH